MKERLFQLHFYCLHFIRIILHILLCLVFFFSNNMLIINAEYFIEATTGIYNFYDIDSDA